ncbi:putative early transcription factor large subunit [Alphaentomopoxvirus acuprea]|uniref:Early transcription factor 82 kDa subunit n=1 Tax=Alphaentomopoxvirus acuprea TaxID=62099 RepID=W6JIZ6_9POXV|nr:putative early transcription factor large subunit [Anomala cuprea entomopoxvirus]BAO49547.1 putative early transcription factor large subunit [Anomala cuprea entomopoxvirus]
MDYIPTTLQPQVIFLFDEYKHVKRTIFLSNNRLIDNSNVMGVYNYLNSRNTKFLALPEYINDHIILSFGLQDARGYIKNILSIEEDIILFSIFNNFDYYYPDNTIFDPYNIPNTLLIQTNPDNKVLYSIDINIVNGAVFCVTTNEYSKTNLARPSIYMPVFRNYIIDIINNIYKNNYSLSAIIKDSMEYSLNNTYKDLIKLSNLDNYKITYCISSSNKFYIKGTKITLIEGLNMEDYNHVLYIYDEKLNPYIQLENDVLAVTKISDFINILKENDIRNINIKSLNPKTIIYIYFNTYLNPNLTIQFDIKFFINQTKTRNIFIDLSNKINIMTSKDHISFRSYSINSDLCKYLTLLILGYSHIFNKIQQHGRIKKVNELYPVRYCQNYKEIKRQPILIENVNKEYLIKISDNFYIGKEDNTRTYQRKGTKRVFDPYKYGDVYIDENGLIYQCASIYYSNMGFLGNIYSASGICYPCCYSKPKTNDPTFLTCVHGEKYMIEEKINPIIINYGRLILSTHGISNLSPKLNSILNKNSSIEIVKHTNRIISANNYTIITSYQPSTSIKDFKELYNFILINNAIIINENTINTHKNILNTNLDTIKVFILIQNRIHQLKNINKAIKSDIINMIDINDDKIRILLNYFNVISNIKTPISDNGITIKNDICYIDDIPVNNKNIKYFTEFTNVSLKPKSTSEYIKNYFNDYLNNMISSSDINLFTKIFVTKIMYNINEYDNIKTDFTSIKNKLDNISLNYNTIINKLSG